MKPTTRLKAAIIVALVGGTGVVSAQGYGGYPYASPYTGNGYTPYASSGYGYGAATTPQSYYQGRSYGTSGTAQSYGTYPTTSGYGYDPYAQQAATPSYSYSGSQPAYGNAASGYGYYGTGQGYYSYYPSAAGGPYAYYPPPVPRRRNWNNWDFGDLLKKDNGPLQNPLDNQGDWADPNFHPWRTGPFAHHKWKDHPMTKFPWGDFPGWGEGFFGNFGPDQWKGVTPWGNDVPFKWVDPSDPEESVAAMWEDAINTPNAMGRLPPGFTMPYISVPNPIDVENEFERNARNSPNEFRNMWSDQGATMGAAPKSKKGKEADKQGKQAAKPKPVQGDGESSQAQAAPVPK